MPVAVYLVSQNVTHILNHPMDHEQQQHDDSLKKRAQTSTQHEYTSITVHDNDVLAGRGNGVAAHPGNQFFRDVCIQYQQKYQDAPRTQKMSIALQAVEDIKSRIPPGRFLRKDSKDNWVEMAPKRVFQKVSQALRDRSAIESPSSLSASSNESPLNIFERGTIVHNIDTSAMDYRYIAAAPRMQQPISHSSLLFMEEHNRRQAMAATLQQSQLVQEDNGQFDDAVDDPMSTSMEILQLCCRKGYL